MIRKLFTLIIILLTSTCMLFADGNALNGAFTINANGDKIVFSQGNLQYLPQLYTWRFAEHQYDVLTTGTAYVDLSASYENWMDLFGWGTSGYNEKYPYMTTRTGDEYGDGENDIAGTNYDWGVYCSNQLGEGWRTLTTDEWKYILKTRQSANDLQSEATVCGISGYILLPDDFVQPEGLSWNSMSYNYSTNTYDQEAWEKMESAGAVFLPAAGHRVGKNVYGLGVAGIKDNGNYWSATHGSQYTGTAFVAKFEGAGGEVKDVSRDYGFSVRLVKAYVAPSSPTSLGQNQAEEHVTKLLQNGQILILRGDKIYTITGQEANNH